MSDYRHESHESVQSLSKQLKLITEQNPPLTKAIEENIKQYNILIKPIIEAAKQWSEIIKKIKILKSLRVIGDFQSSQYVFWDYLKKSFISTVIEDVDCAIYGYESENKYSVSEDLIYKCRSHSFLAINQPLFKQTVDAYHQGMYNIAAVGFTALIDSVLSEATNNKTHKPRERYRAILDKLKENESVTDNEYAILILYATFDSMAMTFYKTIPFSDPEPLSLNRNWIAHGRSQREYTRIDCIKLLRFLYGIILVDNIDSQCSVTDDSSASLPDTCMS